MDKRWSLIALHQIRGVGWHTIGRLQEVGWQPGDHIQETHLSEIAKGKVPAKVINAIRSTYSPEYVQKVMTDLQKTEIQVMTFFDSDYPHALRELPQPPWVLYLLGDPTLLHTPCIAMVGTRKPTPYGKKVAQVFAESLSGSNWTIVSGMALGIDGLCHQSVLESGGKTIAVLGSGVDVVYPTQHRALYQEMVRKGLIVSEVAPGTTAKPGLFPQRNRIVSGLSQGVLVVEAAEKSGTLITADFALEQGKDVFAIPGSILSEQSRGTNRLIQQGAKCVLHPNEILEEYEHLVVPASTEVAATKSFVPTLTETEQQIWNHLSEEPISLAALLPLLRMVPIGEVHRTLLQMEMKRYIQQLPGSRYIRLGEISKT